MSAPQEGAPSAMDASPAPSTSGPSGTKLFLGGLSWSTTEEKLRSYFSKFGEVEDVVVMKDKVSKQPRGFGFVTFKSPESAQQACESGPHSIDDRMIDCKPSIPQGQQPVPSRSKKIFVGGLAPETTEEEFKTYFGAYGTISEAQIMVDYNSGRSRGFGFVTFEEEESVARVFGAGAMHTLGGKQVEVKTATPKGSGPQAPRAPMPGRGYPGGGRGGGRGGYEGYGAQGYGMAGYGYPGYGMPGQYGQYGMGYGYGGMMPYYGQYGQQGGYGYGGYGPTGYGMQGGMQQGGDGRHPGGRRGGPGRMDSGQAPAGP